MSVRYLLVIKKIAYKKITNQNGVIDIFNLSTELRTLRQSPPKWMLDCVWGAASDVDTFSDCTTLDTDGAICIDLDYGIRSFGGTI